MSDEQVPVYKTAQRIAVDYLRAAILNGRFSPGTSISQDDVASQLRISRQPVREALRELAAEGLLELRAHRSALVVSLEDRDIAEIFGIRSLLEARAVELAVSHVSKWDLERLRQYCSEMTSAMANKDAEHWLALNRQFHQLIAQRCPWPRLHALIEAQHNALAPYFRLWGSATVTPTLIEQMPRFHDDHERILSAIERADAGAAAAATAEHVDHSSRQLRRVLTDLSVKPPKAQPLSDTEQPIAEDPAS